MLQQLRTLPTELHMAHRTDNPITSVAFSEDLLAVGLRDGRILILDLDGEVLLELEGHSDWVNSVAWSPDGARLASGSSDDKVLVWDVGGGDGAGEVLLELEGHSSSVYSLAWSPDGAQLASASFDEVMVVSIVSIERACGIAGLQGYTWTRWGAHYGVTFSPDGQALAFGDSFHVQLVDMNVSRDKARASRLSSGSWQDLDKLATATGVTPDGQPFVETCRP